MKKNTSFGSMETLLERDGRVVSELLYFNREGRSHSHEQWEVCYVLNGQGVIVVGNQEVPVKANSVCKIPPNTPHWMIPEEPMEILLVYTWGDKAP